MVNNFKRKGFNDYSMMKGEVIYKNHTLEFLRFFESHKRLCDEISGLKYHNVGDLDGGKPIIISKVNFGIGIKKLNSFIIDFSHYIEEKAKLDEVWGLFYALEDEFINDGEYNGFVAKHDNLSSEQLIIFNKKYINYLVKTFDISFLMSKYLQKSLNIASREVVKNIQFANYDGFFNNLSVYREEIAGSLSNLSFESLFENFKKLMGYFYTYKYLIASRERVHIDFLLRFIHRYITLDDTVKNVLRVSGGESLGSGVLRELRGEFVVLRNAFNMVYFLCNFSLSMKNILPKSKVDVLLDSTLI